MTIINTLAALGIECPSGKKTTGFIPVEGSPVNMPFTLISGAKPGKEILITGGVHGGEYPCIETAIRLAQELLPETVSGTILIIHPVNTAAFLAKMQYYGPYDGKNLNREFPGKAKGTVSERIAYVIHQFQQSADLHMDLHGGDLHESLVPFVIYSSLGSDEVNTVSHESSGLLGFPYAVRSTSENGTFGAAAIAGTHGFLAELGQCGRWSEPEVAQYMEAVRNVLRSFQSIPGQVIRHKVQYLDKMLVTTAENEGCWYPCKQLEDWVKKGEKVGEIRDYFGKVQSEYLAKGDGVLLYLVTSLAITPEDPLFAIGVK